jgi:hypothetical protein
MPKRKLIYLIVLFFFSALFYYLKWQSPHLITGWYEAGQFDWLNRLSNDGVNQSRGLSFYLGRIEESFFGPLTQLISGLLFAGFALLFLSRAGRLKFGLAVFLYLLLTKFDVLGFPPYGDAIGGPFAEAIWLKKNHFNYAGLFAQPGYAAGGPKVYVFTIYPTCLALLMTVFWNVKVFLAVNHLLVFAMAAAIAAWLRDIAVRVFSRDAAILLSLILLYMPLFQSQTEAINMEMPCVFFIMCSAHALVDRKIGRAALMAILAMAVKGIGVFAGAAVVTVAAFMALGKVPEFRPRKILGLMLA